jgi:hypothetical protein
LLLQREEENLALTAHHLKTSKSLKKKAYFTPFLKKVTLQAKKLQLQEGEIVL